MKLGFFNLTQDIIYSPVESKHRLTTATALTLLLLLPQLSMCRLQTRDTRDHLQLVIKNIWRELLAAPR